MIREEYIQGEYLKRNPTWHAEDSPWKATNIVKIIQKNNLKPNTICEIGCGAGEILSYLHQHMADHIEFFGYEISPQAYAICEQKKKERLSFYSSDLFQDSPPRYFDIVLIIDVIEHIEDYFSFLREVSKKGMYKIFHVPLDISVQSVLRSKPILKARQDIGHIHYFTKETALAALVDTGYEIIDYFYTAGSIDLRVKSMKSLLARWPREILYKINKDMAVRILGGHSLMVLAK